MVVVGVFDLLYSGMPQPHSLPASAMPISTTGGGGGGVADVAAAAVGDGGGGAV